MNVPSKHRNAYLVTSMPVRYNAALRGMILLQIEGRMAAIAPLSEHAPVAPVAPSITQRFITFEYVLYALLGVAAVLLHLYALDARALHHDETLHATFSWNIYQGRGYQHDPLLHGPFLYYITAFTYWLFGDTDYTARLSVALFGIAATLLPALLRREMGRGAALLACTYLAISPVFVYIGRFLRHDMYAVTFELISVIALVRYVATERPLWHYTLAASMSLMLATMETFYLFLLITGSFVGLWLLWQVAPRLLWVCAAYGSALVGVFVGGRALAGPIPLPTSEQALAVRNQPDNDLGAYFVKMGGVLLPMLRHPAVLGSLVLSVLFLGALLFLIFRRRDTDGRSAWRRAADAAPPGTLIGALDRVPRRQWLIAFAIAFAIYAVFYMALPSNPGSPNTAGIVTGVTGSLLYWLGQHGVQRGNQPLHYYVFQLSVYEPLLLVFGPLGVGVVLAKLWRMRARAGVDPQTQWTRTLRWQRLFTPALLAWWSVGTLLLYSWAGEKMPWLTIHLVLPLALLGAWALAQVWQWAARGAWAKEAVGLTSFTVVLLLLVFNRVTVAARTPSAGGPIGLWLLVALVFVGLLALGLTINYRSVRPAVRALLVLLCVFGTLATVRSLVRVVFVNGDVPVEPLVYVQTSPDVSRVMTQLRSASLLRTGTLDLPIQYDNETIWMWYLRNYQNTAGSGSAGLTIRDDTQAVFLLAENVESHRAQLDGFVQQPYPLRWWFPECSVYRLRNDATCSGEGTPSLLSRLLHTPTDNTTLAEAWRFWFDRRLPTSLGSVNWSLFVRPELAAEFNIAAKNNEQ